MSAPAAGIRAIARAKVNLSLEVRGRRPDGYHDLTTILQTIELHDTLTASPAPDGVLDLTIDGLRVPGPPGDNLVRRAAEALHRATGRQHGARLRLEKRIPVAAGLGGGSADAAAALLALDTLWDTRLGADALAELAAGLGSDVPFCLLGGAALAEGRGERLTPLPTLTDAWVVLIPLAADLPGKTRRLYAALTPDDWSDGGRTWALADALLAGDRIHHLGPNAFQTAALATLPGVGDALTAIEAAAPPGAAGLSGSGPSVFALLHSARDARRVAAALEVVGYNAVVTRPAARGVELAAETSESERARCAE